MIALRGDACASPDFATAEDAQRLSVRYCQYAASSKSGNDRAQPVAFLDPQFRQSLYDALAIGKGAGHGQRRYLVDHRSDLVGVHMAWPERRLADADVGEDLAR